MANLWRTVKKTAKRLKRDSDHRVASEVDEPGPLDGLTLHSLRHSYAGVAESVGATLPTIGALLGHTAGKSKEGVGGAGGVTGGYILKRLDLSLIEMADRVSDHIVRAMRGQQVTAEIISFQPRSVSRKVRGHGRKSGNRRKVVAI
ncbi:hypothetical protein [Nitrobacter winogradskyi]|uniref:Uncharacterized protein n=2 Tax=Nitrobacter winogradskyi TaxID=913 RepID=A0ACC6AIH5_NITWI|nr:hypothetical protein [Nitrobacter winogradskyi]MCP1999648.1 hypothetical protein [Nitrobacter winogradskyi]GEC17492.1 hypothetical protein NWI01_33840 [Nitrobacter winogradskyi]